MAKTLKAKTVKSAVKTVTVRRDADAGKVSLRLDHRARVGRLFAAGIDGSSVWNSADNKSAMLAWLESKGSALKRVSGSATHSLKMVGKMGTLFWKVSLAKDGKTYTRVSPEGTVTGSVDCLKLGKIAVTVIPLARAEGVIRTDSRKEGVAAQEVEFYFPSLVRKATK